MVAQSRRSFRVCGAAIFICLGLEHARADAYLLVTGSASTIIAVDGKYRMTRPMKDEIVSLGSVSPGLHRLKVVTLVRKREFTVFETSFRAGEKNLIVLRPPDYQPRVLPNPAQPVQVGSLTISGPLRSSVILPDWGGITISMQDTGAPDVLTWIPPGKYQAVSGPQSAKYTFEIVGGQQTVLFIDRASYQVVRDNAEDRARQAAPMPTLGGGYDRRIPDLGLDLVWIGPGGFFKHEAKSLNAISPAKQVAVAEGFWLGRTEITQAQQFAIVGNNTAAFPSYAKGPDRPVDQGSWEEAMEFCRLLTERERAAGRLPAGYAYSLPTEAQWEYAARAGDKGERMGDRELDAAAWTGKNSDYLPQAVDVRTENAWGLADMFGNVWEMCLDWDAQTVPIPGQPAPGSDPFKDSCALRGGSFETYPSESGFRYSDHHGRSHGNGGGSVGFRVALVRPAQPVPAVPGAPQH